MELFKKRTRQQELDEYSDGITASIINRDFTPCEMLDIHEQVVSNLVSHLERKKSELLIKSKKANSEYKKASFVLTKMRNTESTFGIKNMP